MQKVLCAVGMACVVSVALAGSPDPIKSGPDHPARSRTVEFTGGEVAVVATKAVRGGEGRRLVVKDAEGNVVGRDESDKEDILLVVFTPEETGEFTIETNTNLGWIRTN